MNAQQPLLVTVQRACELLSVDRKTLWRMWRDGEIATTKLRGRRLVPMTEVERLAGEAVPELPPHHQAEADDEGEPVGEPARKRPRKRKLSPRSS